ncbi:Cys/Met metabolism pyridoxal-phosphate-dependent protein [Leptothrix cholodnii SP-6]|uniref:Cys/Met metabolism pyridoxal-phosphate-dependent protein n=1 Tax=Leptothrix cholodnii (strain ATCC 51168 / LMG 8142 / SP-6) TaxID=395495 RepID=B1Y224_LEPCP|nr:PLP-dependent transferase [Leptothrix cholodnii]ACB34323.1 Cys/Met metabolism pyridoxal-phosphate-dependent protein [Leptothrix cholodnii SP-6]
MTDPQLATALIHHPYRAPAEWDAIPTGVFKASTVFFPNVAAMRERRWIDKSAYTYGLKGTPTTFTLEARLATLEGAEHLMLVPSGLAAIMLIDLAVLKTGDAVLLPDNAYGPSMSLAQHELRHWGITHQVYDPMDVASLSAALTPATRLVWLEAAGSVTMEFPDLRALIRCVRREAPQALIAIDHTWGAGLAFKPFALGAGDEDLAVDFTAHALTKYPSGGGDVLLGSVGCRDRRLHDQLAWCHARLGLGVGVDDVAAVLRGLPTLPLRYAAQDQAARRIASWAQGRAEVARVLHPALPDSPGHAHWAALCTQAAGIFSIEMQPGYSQAQVDAFVDALKLFRIGWSWAGPVSLVVPYEVSTMRRLPTPYRGALVRLCIGLEDVDDLIADLDQALARLSD